MNDYNTGQDYPCECRKPDQHHHFHWRNTALYQYEYCSQCGDIKSFHWKSFWRRLKDLFSNETL